MAVLNKTCIVCNKEYCKKKGVSLRQWNNSSYCSLKCFNSTNIGKKLTEEHKRKISLGLIGKECKKETREKISKSNMGKIRTEEMKKKNSLAHLGKPSVLKGSKRPEVSGENHWAWKGGRSKNYKSGYYSFEYKKWRSLCMERDNYECQECGDGGYLTVHRIKSFAHYPELRFDLSNGVTLCEECHSKTDNYKGRAIKKLDKILC